MEVYKRQQEINMQYFDKMIEMGLLSPDPSNQEAMVKMMVVDTRKKDQLFFETGVEEDQLT